jgi:hypothetical protein
MALTPAEEKRYQELNSLFKKPEQASVPKPQKPNFFEDFVGDVKETGKAIVTAPWRARDAVTEAATNAGRRARQGDQSLGSAVFETLGSAASGTANTTFGVAGDAAVGAGKAALSQDAEDKVAGTVTDTVQAVTESDLGQRTAGWYNSLPEDQKALLRGTAGFAELGLDAASFGAGTVATRAGREVAEQGIKTGAKGLQRGAQGLSDGAKNLPKVVGSNEIVQKGRLMLSDYDKQARTVIERADPELAKNYVRIAEEASIDPKKATPLEVAGTKAENAYGQIKTKINKETQAKKSILNEFGDAKVGNLDLFMNRTLNKKLETDFGAKMTKDGFEAVKGRTLKLDSSDQRLLGDYVSKYKELGATPTAREVDDFVDWAQSQLYRLNTPTSKYQAVDTKVVSALKQQTGELNSKLKTFADKKLGNNVYSEKNDRISQLLTIDEELNRALGKDANKGGSLMKRVFSPTDGGTKDLFERILNETGIDLVDEATLAKFAMEQAGDTRQKSLLNTALGKSAEIADQGLIMGFVNFLREQVDLDGEDLIDAIRAALKESS